MILLSFQVYNIFQQLFFANPRPLEAKDEYFKPIKSQMMKHSFPIEKIGLWNSWHCQNDWYAYNWASHFGSTIPKG